MVDNMMVNGRMVRSMESEKSKLLRVSSNILTGTKARNGKISLRINLIKQKNKAYERKF